MSPHRESGPTLIPQPTVIEAAGNKPKRIEEYAGLVNSGHGAVSVARRPYSSSQVGNETPPLGKDGGKNQRAERLHHYDELRRQDAFGDGEVRIAKYPDSEGGGVNHGKCKKQARRSRECGGSE